MAWTLSAGSLVGFAMECYERGWITKEETGGIELKWGSSEALIATLVSIGERKKLGLILGKE